MKKVRLILLVMLVAAFAAATANAADFHFKANLTPEEEVSKPKADSSGYADFKFSRNNKVLTVLLKVKNIQNVTAAHIHLGKKGENGPPIVQLFAGKKAGTFSGVLSEGRVTKGMMMGDFKGKTLPELVNLMKAGVTYVNVHTEANPDGEIRGQIENEK